MAKKQGSVTIDMGADKAPIIVSTGKLALLAGAAVSVEQGETMVLVTVCVGGIKEGADFFPLTVNYKEKYSANGRFPGGYQKREARPGDHEILISRMTDRPIRPLFTKGFYNEVQVAALVLSYDGVNEPDVLSMLGAAAALQLSDLPYKGPHGSVRVGRINGQFVANPTIQEMQNSDLDLIYSGIAGKTIMIEGDCDELTEEVLFEAMKFADVEVIKQIAALNNLHAQAGQTKGTYKIHKVADDILAGIKSALGSDLDAPCLVIDKAERGAALKAVLEKHKAAIVAAFPERDKEIPAAFEKLVEKNVRRLILEDGRRSDGRGVSELRPLSGEVAVLGRTHGSSIFARGETQGLITVTLGSGDDAQTIDKMAGELEKTFTLHYNFPPFSVGECGRMGQTGNREIGHGNLAERSLAKMMPKDYPYTVRVISEIMGSNGSTSMASICGGSLALFDAGVPLKKAVAGISCGLVSEGDKFVLLTDILGSEDHWGDMDFKVAGTRDGITGYQLDLKIAGIPLDMMYQAMLRDKTARMQILDVMDATLAGPRESISKFAPQMHVKFINPEKIGALIGTGGKNIRGICETTGAKVDVIDSGKVTVFAANAEKMKQAIDLIDGFTMELEIGKIYRGVVASIKEFGAFVTIFGQDGLLHISELADYRVQKVEDVVATGDVVSVKVLDIDDRGRIRLSRRAALAEM